MNLADVQQRIDRLDVTAGGELIYDLLAAYGTPQATVTKLRSGTLNRSGDDDTVLMRRKVWDIYMPDADEAQLLGMLDRAQTSTAVGKMKPMFYIARNDTMLAAVDNRTGQTLATPLTDLARHTAFFMPWTGARQVRTETVSLVDNKVAKQMAKLYDEILATNPTLPDTEDGRRNLNTFFSRLLFCFFAEDTGVFDDGIFTDTLTRLTADDGSDAAEFLDQLFIVLDTPDSDREGVASHFEPFGYVNGSLFTDRIHTPRFSRKARNIVVDCARLDWTAINPDIFGSMIQAVTAGEERANLGMHYTSVENILKVLNPLFLDDLEERFASATTVKKLEELLDRLADIRVFDPACGSGNFLIIAYKRLRDLEHRIIGRIAELTGKPPLFADSRISLEDFYGIELDDFAHDIAKLSLWFAKHQMNQEYDDLFGHSIPLIPLRETGAIHCANATRVDWTEICPPTDTTYICGNPPYLGSKWQDASHKADFAAYFAGREKKYPKDLDYISLWFLKAADWLQGDAVAAFVSTNSICQGQQVELLWGRMLERHTRINFAHTSFIWANGATGNAEVTCIVVGFALAGSNARLARIFTGSSYTTVKSISPYLTPGAPDFIVAKRREPLCGQPNMYFGNMPRDGGHLVLSAQEADELLHASPGSASFVRPYMGSSEMLKAQPRYCLWVADEDVRAAREIGEIDRRLNNVAAFRADSKAESTRKYAERPNSFVQVSHQEAPCIAVPSLSSVRRKYIPMGYFPAGTVASNQIFLIYGAEPWLFALLQSAMHMTWVRAVGGMSYDRSIRYANTICYNTYPFPALSRSARDELDSAGLKILASRERWPDRSLATLYDPDGQIPANVRAAHEANDALVDSLYRSKPFASDADRMELLLGLYRDLVAAADEKKAGGPKKKGG